MGNSRSISWIYRKGPYTEADEIGFLTQLRRERPERFPRQAEIILQDLRIWDPTVDVAAVKAAVRRMQGWSLPR